MPAEEFPRVQLLPRTPRLVDEVVSCLQESIIDGSLPAGTQLSQVALAEQLGVSRTPLREALRVLESAGLLRTSDSNRTAEVVPLGADDLRDLYQLREVIDGLAARLAARNGLSAADQKRARELLDELAKSSVPYDPVRRDRTHTQFHELVANASDNDKIRSFGFLIRISSAVLYLPLRRQAAAANLTAVDPGKSYREILEQAQIQHREIVDAIVARDPDAAETAARRHIQQTLRLAIRLG